MQEFKFKSASMTLLLCFTPSSATTFQLRATWETDFSRNTLPHCTPYIFHLTSIVTSSTTDYILDTAWNIADIGPGRVASPAIDRTAARMLPRRYRDPQPVTRLMCRGSLFVQGFKVLRRQSWDMLTMKTGRSSSGRNIVLHYAVDRVPHNRKTMESTTRVYPSTCMH